MRQASCIDGVSGWGAARFVRHESDREIDTRQFFSLHQQRRNRLAQDVRTDSPRAARSTAVAAKSRTRIATQRTSATAKSRLTAFGANGPKRSETSGRAERLLADRA